MLARSIDVEPLGPDSSVLDLCCGSGVLGIHAALRGAGEVWAVDISRRAVAAARLNARLNGVRVRACRGDLFAAVPGLRFDLIVSNPPYLPGPAQRLPERGLARAWEAGPRGRAFLDRICAGVEAEVIARYPGRLGPILSARASWLRSQGLLDAHGEPREEIVIVRGERVAATRPATAGGRRWASDPRGHPGASDGGSSPRAPQPPPRRSDGRAGSRRPSAATPS